VKKHKWAVAGFVFGLLAVPFGVFAGLQISPVLATALIAPVISVSWIAGVPLGELPAIAWLICLSLNGLFGMGIALAVKALSKR